MAISARQNLMARAYLAIAAKVGPWEKGNGAEGAAYVPASLNSAKAAGFACHNCVFWKAPKGCAIVKGEIEREAICRLHVISDERLVRAGVRPTPRGRVQGDIG